MSEVSSSAGVTFLKGKSDERETWSLGIEREVCAGVRVCVWVWMCVCLCVGGDWRKGETHKGEREGEGERGCRARERERGEVRRQIGQQTALHFAQQSNEKLVRVLQSLSHTEARLRERERERERTERERESGERRIREEREREREQFRPHLLVAEHEVADVLQRQQDAPASHKSLSVSLSFSSRHIPCFSDRRSLRERREGGLQAARREKGNREGERVCVFVCVSLSLTVHDACLGRIVRYPYGSNVSL